MCYRQRDVINPHGLVGYGMDFGSKPECWNGGGRHSRILMTLPLSTRILMTESAILVKVEKMEVRRGSSDPGSRGAVKRGLPGVVFRGWAKAIVHSSGVNGLISLMMHPIKPGNPSKPAASSGSAS